MVKYGLAMAEFRVRISVETPKRTTSSVIGSTPAMSVPGEFDSHILPAKRVIGSAGSNPVWLFLLCYSRIAGAYARLKPGRIWFDSKE